MAPGAGALARENIACHFLAPAVQQRKMGLKYGGPAAGVSISIAMISRFVQMKTRAMWSRRMRQERLRECGNLEADRSGAARYVSIDGCWRSLPARFSVGSSALHPGGRDQFRRPDALPRRRGPDLRQLAWATFNS